MIIQELDGKVKISDIGPFSAVQTFDSGQCFRWTPNSDGSYTGVAYGKAAKISSDDDSVTVSGTKADFLSVWKDYLDLSRDYDAIRKAFSVDDFTKAAGSFGSGIRILKQEPWEALCSFIISQCNNIPRIQSIISTLCKLYGEKILFDSKELFTFPSAERISSLALVDLSPLRCGYRAPYILNAAKAIASGELCFERLRHLETEAARAEIMKLQGVGRKVADCFLLFGLNRLDAFPIDTWMKKAAAFYPGDMRAFQNSPYAGIFQQYIFYYARSMKLTL